MVTTCPGLTGWLDFAARPVTVTSPSDMSR
jgi:hypothetical protein